MNKRILGCLLMGLVTTHMTAQSSSTLSPYSQYSLGVLAEQSIGASRGMGGLAYGMRSGKQINMINPASYSSVDSLTMLFDAGVSARITNFKEGNKKVNGRTGNFDYAVASFRLFPKIGIGVGVVPYSHIGYDYDSVDKESSTTEGYFGDGGFSQVFLGAGWEFAKGFSIGFNVSYFWGSYSKNVLVTNSDSKVSSILRDYSTSVSSYKLDFGAQWQGLLNKDNLLTVGLTASVGHNLHATASVQTVTTDPQTGVTNSSDPAEVENAFSLPWTFGVGATVLHKNSLTVGADYTLQRWGAVDYPVYTGSKYFLSSDYYKDRHKFVVGANWVPNPVSRNYFMRVNYRLGVSYATPYYKIKGSDGPSEFTLGGGVGLPIARSMLHISGQWVRSNASGLISENMFRINLGLTFNERWFAKWKVD